MSEYLDEVLDIGCRMAQELQEFVDAGEESGSNMAAPRALLDEWNEVYNRSGHSWKQQLAEKVGIKFQQIQKYETGMNRVSASRLWDISEALSVPIDFFFEGLEAGSDPAEATLPGDILADKEALELVRSYYAIPENQRRRLFELARVLSDAA